MIFLYTIYIVSNTNNPQYINSFKIKPLKVLVSQKWVDQTTRMGEEEAVPKNVNNWSYIEYYMKYLFTFILIY